MKQVLTLCLLTLFTAPFYSQSVDKGRIQLKAGIGFFLSEQTSSNWFPQSGLITSSGAKNKNFGENNISFLINTHKDFSLGVTVVNQSFRGVSDITSQGVGICAEYYMINNPNFNLYVNTTAGKLKGVWNSRNEEEVLKQSAAGSFNSFGLGMNTYLGKVFGFYVVAGYKRQGVQVSKASIEGENKDYIGNIKTKDLKYLNRGGFLNFGITIKLRNKSGGDKPNIN